MPKSHGRKHGGRPVTYRPVSPVMLTSFSAGIRCMPAKRCLDAGALSDALNRLASQGRLADLRAIAVANDAACIRYADMLAAENPGDSRWDDWRNYRKARLSYAN